MGLINAPPARIRGMVDQLEIRDGYLLIPLGFGFTAIPLPVVITALGLITLGILIACWAIICSNLRVLSSDRQQNHDGQGNRPA